MVPEIETARLRLRSFHSDDGDAMAAMLGDPAVTRYLGGTPFAREYSWRRMLTSQGLWSILGYGYWAVERRDNGLMIGQVGFADFKRDMLPSIENIPEMGWVFAPHGQGQGYALEAVEAGLRWADRSLPGQEFVAIIDPRNQGSIRVAEKSGFSGRGPATYDGNPILLFRRPPVSPAAASAAAAPAA